MKTLTNDNGQKIIGNPGTSSYFRGDYKAYGKYQWNVKYYNWEANHEIESARDHYFGNQTTILVNRGLHNDNNARRNEGF